MGSKQGAHACATAPTGVEPLIKLVCARAGQEIVELQDPDPQFGDK